MNVLFIVVCLLFMFVSKSLCLFQMKNSGLFSLGQVTATQNKFLIVSLVLLVGNPFGLEPNLTRYFA